MRYLIAVILVPAFLYALQFTTEPSLTQNGPGSWTVAFAVNENTDVEVAVVDTRDSSIVRHLAGGMLGANPPAPLAANSLSQSLNWDGTDDLGNAVPGGTYDVRVRAGMSVSLDKFAGGNPNLFKGMGAGYWSFKGLVGNKNGKVYVMGSPEGSQSVAIREFNGNGTYSKTVFPYPANLSASQVSGWGLNTWLDGAFVPKMADGRAPLILTPKITASNVLLPVVDSNRIWIRGDNFTTLVINTDGSVAGDLAPTPLITNPALPYWRNLGGTPQFTLSPDGKYFLLSCLYEYRDYTAAVAAVDTGFWREGQVFKVDKATGVVSPFIEITDVPYLGTERPSVIGPLFESWVPYAAIHGTAFDDSGRIYICDRVHSRIGVYDTLGAFLGSVPVKFPDEVEVDSRTGAIYVVTKLCTSYGSGIMKLYKFNGWRGVTAPACSLLVTTGVAHAFGGNVQMVLNTENPTPVVWLGYVSLGIRLYQESGSSFTLLKDLSEGNTSTNLGYVRLAVDRRTEKLYVNDGWDGMFQIEDWGNPQVLPCTSSAGQRIMAWDMALSFDYQLYVRTHGSTQGGPLHRYSVDHRPAPIPFANSGSHCMSPYIYSRYGIYYGEKGLAIAPDKRVAINYMYDWSAYFVGILGDSAQPAAGNNEVDTAVKPLPGENGGVKYDLQGNLYIGVAVRSTAHQIPAGFTGDASYNFGVGAVIKYAPGARGSFNLAHNQIGTEAHAVGAAKVYLPGLAPFSGYKYGMECACRSPRFDVDRYGRLFIPNAITANVAVTDNAGNEILTFGSYGNWDSQGAGSLVPTPAIPMAWPVGVAASDNFLYVADEMNTRIVRVRMDYALENMRLPETAANGRGVLQYAPTLAAAPNPFNPESRITLDLPSPQNVRLQVFSAAGRLVQTLSSGALKSGTHHFTWNGKDASGRTVSAGLYAYRLQADGEVLTLKTVYAK